MTELRDSRKSRDRFLQSRSSLHGQLVPADIRREDRVSARLYNEAFGDYQDCKLWRLSPFGVEVLSKAEDAPEKGSTTSVQVTIDGKSSRFEGVVVEHINPIDEDENILVGIRFTDKSTDNRGSISEDRREGERWLCSEQFYPTCVTPTPGRINDYIYFRIHDISQKGMLMKCSLRNKHLLPDMSLQLFAQFPGCENTHLDVCIKRIGISEEAGRDILTVGVEFTHLGQQSRKSIGQYLLQFSKVQSVTDLTNIGFNPASVSKGVEFYFLKSEEDYRDVLKLRRLAHIAEGTLNTEVPEDEMGDVNDARSRIIVGKIAGVVVATARLRFNESDAPLEHEAHIDWPAHLPRRNEIVEISRACTHPDYRKGDLFTALWRQMATYALQRQQPYIVIGSWQSMIGFYNKVGFARTGISHGEKIWNRKQEVLICNLHESVFGKNTHPLYWNQLYRKVAEYAISSGLLVPTDLEKIRMSAYSKLGWLSSIVSRSPRKK